MIFEALKLTESTITECMTNVYPTIGWSDVHLKNASKDVKEAIEKDGVDTIATIRPILGNLVNDNGDLFVAKLEVSIIASVIVTKIEEVEMAVQKTCDFPTELQMHLRERHWSRKLTGFTKVELTGMNFPIRDPADDYSLVDARFTFTKKGKY